MLTLSLFSRGSLIPYRLLVLWFLDIMTTDNAYVTGKSGVSYATNFRLGNDIYVDNTDYVKQVNL